MLAIAPITPWHWVAFIAGVLVLLFLDLGVFHRRAHVIKFKEAVAWTAVWFSLAMLFAAALRPWRGQREALEFVTGYLIELSLSMDNVFVIALIFAYFRIPAVQQHRVLFWGILGALITRGAFIAVGAALLAAFHWVTYIFGVFLVVTALRLVFGGDEEVRPEKNPVLALFRRFVRTTPDYAGTHFFVRQGGKLYATPLLTVLVVIEATDVVFAVDSIPAVFGVTRDVFIVYTSNIFAVLGLRALTFLVARLVQRLRYLKIGLGLVLAFVGGKMLIADRYHISDVVSLLVVAGLIGLSAVASLLVSNRNDV
jgi:tellurite resistance protein TerC